MENVRSNSDDGDLNTEHGHMSLLLLQCTTLSSFCTNIPLLLKFAEIAWPEMSIGEGGNVAEGDRWRKSWILLQCLKWASYRFVPVDRWPGKLIGKGERELPFYDRERELFPDLIDQCLDSV
ncbi:hypothetical protein JCGZ_20208 [Jatropha curcas]|uniref:Uncharacterized protein n=1 Tax=Jatropha curcas TaxID=180498 RepID=A0A067K6E5_JATCU|nr:hypothetical protein JCGZ_20208 [Jatropha curcas]